MKLKMLVMRMGWIWRSAKRCFIPGPAAGKGEGSNDRPSLSVLCLGAGGRRTAMRHSLEAQRLAA